MIADQLSARHSVLILEAGLRIERAQAVENWRNMPFANRLGSDFQGLYPQSPLAPAPLYFPENNYVHLTGPSGSGFKQGYLRTVGGTTWHWAASCWRHLPVDLRMQSAYGVGRDWPISYEELEPYYLQAENEMGVAGPNDPAQQSPVERSGPYPMDMVPWAYGDQRFADVVNPHGYRSVPIPQGRSTRPGAAVPPVAATTIVSLSVRSAPCTTASIMSRRPRRRAPSCCRRPWSTRSTRTRTIASPPCTGTTRRASRTRPPAGISCWPATRWKPRACCSWPPMNATPPALPIRLTRWAATSWTTRASIASSWPANRSGRDAARRRAAAWWAARRRFRSAYSANKMILNNITQVASATQAAMDMGLAGKALDAEIRRRAAHGVDLSISLEPLPDPNNRLTLSKTRMDPLGLPCPDVNYDVGDYVRKGAEAAHAQLRHIGTLFQATEFRITTQLNANNHMMGSVIMGANPKDSVVNGDCRAHDHDNLWLPGGGAMPSASVVNSTLSMAALGLKAAAAIAKQMDAAA